MAESHVNIKKRHLKTSTPYNTYQISGLPPGPIANPGKKTIEAALFPADTDFLYFVSKKDNTEPLAETTPIDRALLHNVTQPMPLYNI